MSYITGVGLTAYGKHEGSSSLDLMSKAAELAICRCRAETHRHRRRALRLFHRLAAIVLATVFAEHFGVRPPMPTPCRSAAPPASP